MAKLTENIIEILLNDNFNLKYNDEFSSIDNSKLLHNIISGNILNLDLYEELEISIPYCLKTLKR